MESFLELMSDLEFRNKYIEFIDEVDYRRREMLQSDASMVLDKGIDIEDDIYSIKDIPKGRFRVEHRGVHLECFAYVKEFSDEQPNKLWVMFSGSRPNQYPLFTRWSYYTFLKGNILCIDDPMVGEYRDLLLGWYYGNREINYRQVVAEFVGVVAGLLKVDNQNIVFMGSSAGGSPVFECASYIPDSCAVAMDPQIKLEQYWYAADFCKITGIQLQNDKWHRNDMVYYIKKNCAQKRILITNLRSEEDMLQLGKTCDELQITVKYGFNFYPKYNLIIWIFDGDESPYRDPHCTVEFYCIAFVIEWLVGAGNDNALCEDSSCFRLVNEFWYDHCLMKKKYLTRNEQIKKIESVLQAVYKTNKCVVIFGCGAWDPFLTDVLDIQGNNYFMIRYAIDNDIRKSGTEFLGLVVRHPSEITKWDELYIIITTNKYSTNVQRQLEALGLEHKKDFIKYEDLI